MNLGQKIAASAAVLNVCVFAVPQLSAAVSVTSPDSTLFTSGSATPTQADTSLDAAPAGNLIGTWVIDTNPTFLWGLHGHFPGLDKVDIAFGPNANFTTGLRLFASANVTPASARSSFVANASNSPDFNAVAAQLTNGSTDDNVFVETGVSTVGIAAGLHSESYWSHGATADFHGYQLTSIELYIDSVSFASPGTDPNGDGNWTDFTIARQLRFYGVAVPEPTSLAGLLIGGLLMQRRRRV